MRITQYGIINECEKEKETGCIKWIKLNFETNKIGEESKKKAILLSGNGVETYKVTKSLAMPNNIVEKNHLQRLR